MAFPALDDLLLTVGMDARHVFPPDPALPGAVYDFGPVPDGMTWDEHTHVLEGTPTTVTNSYVATLTATLPDGSASSSATLLIVVVAADAGPVIPDLPDLMFQQGVQESFVIPAAGESVDLINLPAGLTYDQNTRTLSGTLANYGRFTATYVTLDEGGHDARATIDIVSWPATVPTLPVLADRTWSPGEAVDFTLPSAGGGAPPYVYEAFPLPDGLEEEGQRIFGTPEPNVNGVLYWLATDSFGQESVASFAWSSGAAAVEVGGGNFVRYAAIKNTRAFTATDFLAGETSTSALITLPEITANAYLAFAVPEDEDDLTIMEPSAFAINQRDAFDSSPTLVTISGARYKWWASTQVVFPVLSQDLWRIA